MEVKFKNIKLVIMDVDGVLTDGRIVYDDKGRELKFFDVTDGFGVTLMHRAGFKLALLSAKASPMLKRRAKDMHIDKVYLDAINKLEIFPKILKDFKVKPQEVCFIGDDLIDLPIIKRVGFAVAVKDAQDDVRKKAHYITKKAGGRGAVREAAEMLLKKSGKWAQVTRKYFL